MHFSLNICVVCLDGSLTMAILGKAKRAVLPRYICITLQESHNSYRIIKSDQNFSCNNVQMQREVSIYLLKNICLRIKKNEHTTVAKICLSNPSGFSTAILIFDALWQ